MFLSEKGCHEFLQLGWQEFVADGYIMCCVLTILLVNFIGINKKQVGGDIPCKYQMLCWYLQDFYLNQDLFFIVGFEMAVTIYI